MGYRSSKSWKRRIAPRQRDARWSCLPLNPPEAHPPARIAAGERALLDGQAGLEDPGSREWDEVAEQLPREPLQCLVAEPRPVVEQEVAAGPDQLGRLPDRLQQGRPRAFVQPSGRVVFPQPF